MLDASEHIILLFSFTRVKIGCPSVLRTNYFRYFCQWLVTATLYLK